MWLRLVRACSSLLTHILHKTLSFILAVYFWIFRVDSESHLYLIAGNGPVGIW